MGRQRRTRGRNIHGILLLDKPAGLTSNDILQRVKRLFDARKVGHTGSLDKPATGLLPLCFGEATKFSGFIIDADKHYRAVCALGIETTTGDAAGEIVREMPVPDLNEQDIERVLAEFRGEIQQVPPMYSALKHKGQRLYELAYKGIEVERPARPVTIHQLRLTALRAAAIDLEVVCSKGTYIRTLAEDIGKRLGTCAHVFSLRRVGAGPYTEANMLDFPSLEKLAAAGQDKLDSSLISIDTALASLPEISLQESLVFFVRQGQAITVPRAPTEGLVRIYNSDRQFLGLGEVLDDGRIAPRKLINL